MKFTKMKAAGIAAGVAAFAFIGTPATAGSVTVTDGDGVDFDAACVVGTSATTPGPNNIVSDPASNDPGGAPAGDGCEGVSNYDGLTESTDFNDVTVDITSGTIKATFDVDGAIPLAGSTCNPATGGCVDLPNNSFVGVGYKALFQNPARQNNTPTNNVGGGCPRIPTGTVFDQHEHWLDGYHHFIGFDTVFDGSKWIYSAQIGSYDPAPDGAFFFTELGTASSSTAGVPNWVSADPAAQKGTHWDVVTSGLANGDDVSVSVSGILPSSNAINCSTGIYKTVYAAAGDTLVNIKGLATADSTVTSPVTVPLSLVPGFSDLTSIGGFIFYSDITEGNSGNNGIVGGTLQGNRSGVSYTGGSIGPSDTLGDSPACPTPTFGGTLPVNPFLNPAVGCQYDDDNIPVPNAGNPAGPWTAINPGERGTFNPEWWDTNYSVS